jgi:hypothetical protein
MSSPAALLCIAGSADPADVARHLSGGRVAHTPDRRIVLVYDTPEAAIRDASAYLRPRALTFVKFGLHVGEEPDADVAQRLAEAAAPRTLWLSAAAHERLAGVAGALEAVDLGYQMKP